MNLTNYIQNIHSKHIEATKTLDKCFSSIEKNNKHLNALITTTKEYAYDRIDEFSSLPLAGVPIAIKDNIMTKGIRTTCGSKMLENYVAPYSATVFQKLEEAGGTMIGKANMDEFAMGSSGEYSYYGPTVHHLDSQRIPGGSSSGSAVAVASDMALASLGTDTAGSVRLPAAFCGLVGAKPTYGRVSRYGVQAMGSSFDQVGVITNTVDDAALLLGIISGVDTLDATTVDRPQSEIDNRMNKSDSIKGLKLVLPKQFFTSGLDHRIQDAVYGQVKQLQNQGAIIEELDVPLLNEVLPVYYTLMPAEVTTNLSRFDGIRYGSQGKTSDYPSLHDYYAQVRTENLGGEVKRRILVGSYVLSSAHYEGFFIQAQKLRRMISEECSRIFQEYDAIIGPTSPELPRKIGQKSQDPMKMYLTDIYTATANIVGLPAISVPCGVVGEDGVDFPVGFHIMTNHWKEDMMFTIARALH